MRILHQKHISNNAIVPETDLLDFLTTTLLPSNKQSRVLPPAGLNLVRVDRNSAQIVFCRSDLPATAVSPRRPHATPTPPLNTSNDAQDPDPHEFSRRLKIPVSAHPSPLPHQKLYNPNADTIPMPHQDSDPLVEHPQSDLSLQPPILSHTQQHSPQRQLLDHRRDDPVRFSNATQITKPPMPSPRSSVNYVSASSGMRSRPCPPILPMVLPLDSALFVGKPRSETAGTLLSAQLKRLYREISLLESKLSRENGEESIDEYKVLLKEKEKKDDDTERDRWKRVLNDHKR